MPLKFTQSELSCNRNDNEVIFSVKDSGIGIQKKYHNFNFRTVPAGRFIFFEAIWRNLNSHTSRFGKTLHYY